MWQLNGRLRWCSTLLNILSYFKGGETFAFCSGWSWCYDWRRQAISIFSMQQWEGNLVSCAECWILCWVSLSCWLSRPFTQASAFLPSPLMWHKRCRCYGFLHNDLYPVVLLLAEGLGNSHFPLSQPHTLMWKIKLLQSKLLLSTRLFWTCFVLELFVPFNQSLQSSLEICPMST